MSIKLQSSGGGSVTIADPASTASNFTLNPPLQNGTLVATDASGNVGIGTNTPNAAAGYTNVTVNNTSGGIYDINVGGTLTSRWYANSTAAFIGSNASIPLVFNTAGSERARIDSSGNLMVGATASTNAAKMGSYFNGLTQNGIVSNDTSSSSGTSFFVCSNNGTLIGNIARVGTTSSVAYNTSSDYRLKENILPMVGALEKVSALKPVTYKWKADGSEGQGFIAHELQAVVPDCVTGEKDAVDADGNPIYQGIDTSFLVATLTAAIQEQQTIIADLKSRIETLEAK